MPQTLRMGFIGAGHVAQEIYLPTLCRMPEVEPLVLCDLREPALDGAFRKFGIRETTMRYQDVLKLQEVDAVLIAVPNYLHARIAEEALRAGKHVLCEKPAGLDAREAAAVEAAAREARRVYMLALPHRFDAETRLLKHWIESGRLGRIYHVRAGMVRREGCPGGWFTDRERSGGGAFIHLGSYLLDLTLWLLGEPAVRRAAASCHAGGTPPLPETPAPELRAAPRATGTVHDVEDAAFVTLRMDRGDDAPITAVLEAAWTMHCDADREYLEVYGDRAGATLWPPRLFSEMDGLPIDVTPRYRASQNYAELARHFVTCVLASERGSPRRPIGDAEDGLRLARVTDLVYRSAAAARELDLPETGDSLQISSSQSRL